MAEDEVTVFVVKECEELEHYNKFLAHYGVSNEYMLTITEPCPQNMIKAARIASMDTLERYQPPPTPNYISPRNEIAAIGRLQRILDTIGLKFTNENQRSIIQSANNTVQDLANQSGGSSDFTQVISSDVPIDERERHKLVTDWFVANGGVINGVKPSYFKSTGRGVNVTQDLAAHSTVVSVPEHILLNADRARESKDVGMIFQEIEGLDDESIVMLFVLYE
eukprot:Ihof_evm2s730 gene=Ihof_evmTU2s730